MRLVKLSLKSATVKWWRSLTLGFFVLAVTVVMISSNSLIMAVKNKVTKVIGQGLTGRLQIRSDDSREDDMVEQYQKSWDSLKPLKASTIRRILPVITGEFPKTGHTLLTRQSVYLDQNGKREATMLIGIESNWQTYREAFLLTAGRYLTPSATDEILLTEEQAHDFGVKVGDSIRVTTKNQFGLHSETSLKVAGTGNFIMLSLFSYKAAYVPAACTRQLAGLDAGDATDILLFPPETVDEVQMAHQLSAALTRRGIANITTAGQKLTSQDLKVIRLDFNADPKQEKVKISSLQEMGKVFKSVGETLFLTLNILVIIMMLVAAILIFNLVYLMGIERYRDIGTLRAIGFSRRHVIRVFMGEVLIVTIIAEMAGVLLAGGLILLCAHSGIPSPIPAMDFIMGKTLFPELDLGNTILTTAAITGVSFAASCYPAYRAAAVDPAQVIRSI